ncbi:MAG: serine/threonine-protein kinase [Acetobacteraceae bacterium]
MPDAVSSAAGLPAQIGRYRVEAVLGRGAMGVVYKAHDPAIDRPVAIKLVRADLLEGAEREAYLARFRREAQAAGRCMHPNIVAIYDYALHEGNPFLAMEFVAGVSLSQALVHTGRFSPDAAVQVMGQVLDALARAHAMGIVHRDVKPANIMLLPDGRVKMTDFGISRLESVGTTQAGVAIGTPAYMSPEQCRGEEVDLRSDLFSAGSVLYELLSGERPFPGRSFAEVAQRLLNEAPANIRLTAPAVSPALAAVLDQALSKRPEQRFASATEMAEAMRSALRGAVAAASSASEPTVFAPPPAVPGFDDATLATIERRLAEHIGPIARHLVRGAARHALSPEELVAEVARNIERPEERERFRRHALSGELTRPGTGRHTVGRPMVFAPPVLERAQRELTRHVGPIARVLVKRAAERARSEAELWELLAGHIEQPAERDAFLRRQSG